MFDLMGAERQKIHQMELAFTEIKKGEAPNDAVKGIEASVAANDTESSTRTMRLMEEICARENLRQALRRVQENRGSPGVDGMTVKELPGYLKKRWPDIREQLLEGRYVPKPVKRVEIPKPDGGIRKLGIPTVMDRFIQQAILQALQAEWDRTFSEHSYGFRPKRSAHQGVAQAQKHIAEGNGWVVDIDLEKFFDRVNHDRLMSRMAKRITDKRALKLIRAYLNAGVMENGLVSPTTEGTPQGGPLSPLLSNIVLDELDRELEKRGHRFVRYADDCNIYVKSERAGHRVMESITRFIARKLKLKVNEKKSAVGRPQRLKFLGFSFTGGKEIRRRIAPQSLERMKERIRGITSRNGGISVEEVAKRLAGYLRGWGRYFGFCQTPTVMRDLDSWIRRRLRCMIWRQWKKFHNRIAELRRRGVSRKEAVLTAMSSKGPWRISHSRAVQVALPNTLFDSLGIPRLEPLVGV